jgi:hypothetical protein
MLSTAVILTSNAFHSCAHLGLLYATLTAINFFLVYHSQSLPLVLCALPPEYIGMPQGRTALQYAAESGNMGVIEVLSIGNAAVDARSVSE